jgi:predicted amidophosphoribosyltransferase
MFSQVAAALASVGALALPTSCAACGTPDDTVCRGCTEAIAAGLWPGPRAVTPTPCPEGMPVAFAAGPYEGPLARLVTAYKDDGRRDVRPVLAPVLSTALDLALRSQPEHRRALARHTRPVLVIPVPTSRAARRRRGDAPLLDLARAAATGFAGHELWCADALRLRRRVADQAGLTARERRLNLEHAIEPRPRWVDSLSGAPCVLVDDVLTTGATLVEARRALLRAGAVSVVAATVCATARRHPQPAAGVSGLGP